MVKRFCQTCHFIDLFQNSRRHKCIFIIFSIEKAVCFYQFLPLQLACHMNHRCCTDPPGRFGSSQYLIAEREVFIHTCRAIRFHV